jgi:hypothetical protein
LGGTLSETNRPANADSEAALLVVDTVGRPLTLPISVTMLERLNRVVAGFLEVPGISSFH